MASSAVDNGTGATITIASWSAQILSVDWSGISRESIETSHLGTAAPGANQFGNRTFIPGDLSDPGSLSITGQLNPDTQPPIDQPAETITLRFAEGAEWEGSGFMTEFSASIPMEGVMEFTATIKFSGPITQEAATS